MKETGLGSARHAEGTRFRSLVCIVKVPRGNSVVDPSVTVHGRGIRKIRCKVFGTCPFHSSPTTFITSPSSPAHSLRHSELTH